MSNGAPSGTDEPRAATVVKVAGAGLLLLGLANVVLAGISATTSLIRMSGGETAALGLLGLTTIGLGVLVARGRRWALVTALVVFGSLFVLQAFVASGGTGPAPAMLTLTLVVLPLVLAVRATRRPD